MRALSSAEPQCRNVAVGTCWCLFTLGCSTQSDCEHPGGWLGTRVISASGEQLCPLPSGSAGKTLKEPFRLGFQPSPKQNGVESMGTARAAWECFTLRHCPPRQHYSSAIKRCICITAEAWTWQRELCVPYGSNHWGFPPPLSGFGQATTLSEQYFPHYIKCVRKF